MWGWRGALPFIHGCLPSKLNAHREEEMVPQGEHSLHSGPALGSLRGREKFPWAEPEGKEKVPLLSLS